MVTDGGTGSALFAEDPDTAAQLIAGEVDNLLVKVAQAASVTIRTHRPVHTVHVFGRLPFAQLADGSTPIELGDFYAGKPRRHLLRFAVPGVVALGLATIAELSFTIELFRSGRVHEMRRHRSVDH
ncbi:hypothetical protein [Streptosporangium canum]|uniref:hypothetical protein n=1 Tax=Streptosporangium canum TaxID=324952 RepID=UPI003414F8BB